MVGLYGPNSRVKGSQALSMVFPEYLQVSTPILICAFWIAVVTWPRPLNSCKHTLVFFSEDSLATAIASLIPPKTMAR